MYVWRRNKNRGILPKYRKSPLFGGAFSYFGGPYRIRTCDPLIANEVLYQLS